MKREEIEKYVEEKIPKAEGLAVLLLLDIRDLLTKLVEKK